MAMINANRSGLHLKILSSCSARKTCVESKPVMVSARTNAPQDDVREQEQLKIFGLRQEPSSSREDNDAVLELPGLPPQKIELKTSTKSSITTARDFGLSHIASWRSKHILASFYDKNGNNPKYTILIPSKFLNEWLDYQEKYIFYDIQISNHLIKIIKDDDLSLIIDNACGLEPSFPASILDEILKKQISRSEIDKYIDEGYVSRKNMSEVIKLRIEYLIGRGITRNNPHINPTFLNDIVSRDPLLRYEHVPGDYQSSADWIREQLFRYSLPATA